MLSAIHIEDVEASEQRIRAVIDAGMRPVVWTVNDPARGRLLARWGARWLITDRPGEMKRALMVS
jgi:glycerophosphoryl diester phosphodiesterase